MSVKIPENLERKSEVSERMETIPTHSPGQVIHAFPDNRIEAAATVTRSAHDSPLLGSSQLQKAPANMLLEPWQIHEFPNRFWIACLCLLNAANHNACGIAENIWLVHTSCENNEALLR
jgi:hypothetical protein